jgi:hypothetical protein
MIFKPYSGDPAVATVFVTKASEPRSGVLFVESI